MSLKRAICIFSLFGLIFANGDESVPEKRELNSLITLALQRDFQIRVVEIDKEISGEKARAAAGYWDPAVSASFSDGALGGGGQAASFSKSQGGELGAASIRANLPTGGTVTVDAAGAHVEDEQFGDVYASKAGIALRQPLLRNLGGASSLSRIRIAKRNYEQSEHVFKLQAIATVTDAIVLYNQVALRKDSLRVAEQSRELARQLVSDTQKRANLGAVEARGVEVAEARLAQRDADVVLQQRLYLDALNDLKRFVSNESLPLVRMKVEIGEMPEPMDWSGELEQDFEYALQHRPDYLQALIELEKASIQAKAAGSEYLPQLDLTARFFRASFGNSFTGSYKGLSDVDDEIFLGVSFSRPLLNRTASAERTSARLFQDRAHLIEQQVQQTIAIQLDNATRRIHSEAQNRQFAIQGSRFAERALEAEERKLKLGQSTTFLVLELQEDLAEAQVRELDASANYNIAVARYYQIKGDTLEKLGIEF